MKHLKQSTTFILLVGSLLFLGCAAHSPFDRNYVSDSIQSRAGFELVSVADSSLLPPDVDLSDGVSEDEAIALALWNNPQFLSDLTELGYARADLIQAGMLLNPALSYLFPIGPKQMEYSIGLPIEFFWQRPSRVAISKLNAEQIAESLVQNGLSLIRDVRISYATLQQKRLQARIVAEEAALQDEIAVIAAARLRAGDISELEESAFRLLAAQMHEKNIHFAQDADLEEIQLHRLVGLFGDSITFNFQIPVHLFSPIKNVDDLLLGALAARPDLRAAELGIEVAGNKLGWEQSKIFSLTAVLDANGAGKEGFEMGPGLQAELPIFNWNNGNRARAKAEMERAAKNYLIVKQNIIVQVRQAIIDYEAAQSRLNVLQQDILPSAMKAAASAEKSYHIGASSYIEFLTFKQQLLDAKLRAAEAEAQVRTSLAALQYSVGTFVRTEE
ncbi:TolC family protein [candidate division KSB1 bacterium]|nr:TolC family protein [candidate division KSB1 bacterium]